MTFMLLDLGHAPFHHSTTWCAYIWHASIMIELVVHVYADIDWEAERRICERLSFDGWVGGWMKEGRRFLFVGRKSKVFRMMGRSL